MDGRTLPDHGTPARIVVAAATAGDGGGWLALRAVINAVIEHGDRAEVWLPSSFPVEDLPVGPRYRTFGRAAGVCRELLGPPHAASVGYVGMSDRLPIVRRPRSTTLVLQNNFLYGPARRDFPLRTRARLALLRLWSRASARRADLIVSATQASVADLVDSTGVDPGRVQVRPIPPQDLPPPRTRQAARLHRVVMVGSVYDYKRFDWAVAALDRWATTRDHALELVHVGGTQEPAAGDRLRDAADHAAHLDVQLLGRADHAATVAAMVSADLLLFPSLRESFGLPLAEALGLGLPAVCTDLPQFRELAGECAEYFVDDATLFDALDRVRTAAARDRMASAGIRKVDANGGWDVLPPDARPAPADRAAS
jgi:glycosyltransferase involved in cell wall biosynthesis